jgi:hypothetical protein
MIGWPHVIIISYGDAMVIVWLYADNKCVHLLSPLLTLSYFILTAEPGNLNRGPDIEENSNMEKQVQNI